MGDNVYVEPNAFSNCPALLVVYARQDDHMANVLATNHFIGIDDLLAQGGAIHIPEILAVLPTHDPAPLYEPFLPSVSPEEPFCGDHPILTPINPPNEFNYFIDNIFTFGTQLLHRLYF